QCSKCALGYAEQIMPKIRGELLLRWNDSPSHCTLAQQCSRSVKMTYRNSESVGGVRRLRNFRQVQETCDHVLHLLLLRLAIADYSRLDGKRRVLGDVQSGG